MYRRECQDLPHLVDDNLATAPDYETIWPMTLCDSLFRPDDAIPSAEEMASSHLSSLTDCPSSGCL